MGTIKPKRLSRQEELMNALKINYRDLAANREGRITQSQKKRILERVLVGALGAISFAVIVGLSMFIIILNLDTEEEWLMFLLCPTPIFASILIIWFGAVFLNNYLVNEDLRRGEVAQIQGLAVVGMQGNKNVSYRLSINGINFKLGREALLRIKHLEPHLVYYLPLSKIVVAVEVME